MAFATISTNSTWATRLAAPILRPAYFVYLDWPTGEVFASTFHKSITVDGNVWTGVGNVSFIEAVGFNRTGAMTTAKVGITSIPQGAVTDATEAAAIGRRAIIYTGLFDEAWENPVLKATFIARIRSAGEFKHTRDQSGNWSTQASVTISNGRNPRRVLSNHHSEETLEGSDTAWRLLPTVERALNWPA